MRKAQSEDRLLGPIRENLQKGVLPEDTKLARKIQLQSADFLLIDGILYHLGARPGKGKRADRTYLQLAVPQDLVITILKQYHDDPLAGHPGISKTLELIRDRYFWEGMNTGVADYVKGCMLCNQVKNHPAKSKAPLGIYEKTGLFQVLSVDIYGPFVRSDRGNKYCLTMVDIYSGWLEAQPLPDQSANTVVTAILENLDSALWNP